MVEFDKEKHSEPGTLAQEEIYLASKEEWSGLLRDLPWSFRKKVYRSKRSEAAGHLLVLRKQIIEVKEGPLATGSSG